MSPFLLLYRVFKLLHEEKMVVSSARTIDFDCFKQFGTLYIININ